MSDLFTNTTQAVAIVADPENIRMIIQSGPESYRKNLSSRDNCIAAGRRLLDEIKAASGMTDELDRRAADYIAKSRATVKGMNTRRAAVTKLFDSIRAEYTALENAVDPSKADTVPAQIQKLRNEYAMAKAAEAENRRRQEEAAIMARKARENYRQECEEDFKRQFNAFLSENLNCLTELNNSCTLDLYDAVMDTVQGVAVELPATWHPHSAVRYPFNLPADEANAIASDALASLMAGFREQYTMEMGDYRQEILDRLPSKKAELLRAQQASAEEAARIAAEMKAREDAERAQKEQQRMERELQQERHRQAEKAGAQAADLFNLAANATDYQPKTKVSKKIRATAPEAFMQMVAMWWSKEGAGMTVDELAKIFKRQMTFCEKIANKDGVFISHPAIEYYDEIKAR